VTGKMGKVLPGMVTLLLVVMVLAACQEPTPAITGRLRGPVDLAVIKGCPEVMPGCDVASEGRPLLLVLNELEDAIRVFDIEQRRFFSAPDPLFPFSIPVGRQPRSLAVDPLQRYAFVVNVASRDVSLVDLAADRLVEIDSDGDSCTSFCGSCRDEYEYLDERCRAGVSRVSLGQDGFLEPDDIAVPAGVAGADVPWDSSQPLPVFVSLTGGGQVAWLQLDYADEQNHIPLRLTLVDVLDVGGLPAGLAVTGDGSLLFIADEASSSIAVLHTADGSLERIEVGGTSRRLALSPDESVLYVVLPDDKEIALVDVASLSRLAASQARADAQEPLSGGENIHLSSIPRSLTFVQGVSTVVFDEAGASPRDYTSQLLTSNELRDIQEQDQDFQEEVVKTFAFVSCLDGTVYVLDAVNHRAIDLQPFLGPNLGLKPVLTVGGEEVGEQVLLDCDSSGVCDYPYLVGFSSAYAPETDSDGKRLSCGGHGRAVLDGSGQPGCQCDSGYQALGQECVAEGAAEILRNYYGIGLRPGITPAEGWVLTWEGMIQGSNGFAARFDGWRLVDERPGLDLAALGIQEGDILQVLSTPLAEAPAGDNPCRPGSGSGESENNKIEFSIAAVGSDFIELQPVEGVDPAACWPGDVAYRARVRGAWTVWGTTNGNMPRLHMVEASELPLERPAYDNGVIALTMVAPPEGMDLPRDSTWTFAVSSGYTPAKFSPTVLAGLAGELVSVDLEEADQAEPGDDRVYMVYEGSNAMIEFFPDNLDSGNYLFYQ